MWGGCVGGATKLKRGKVVKQKGITLDMANDEVVNFETMRDMVLNGGAIKSKERFQFQWDTKTKDIITKHVSRSIKSTVKEKRTIDGYDSKPFGWGGEHLMIGPFYPYGSG